jgi:hypothetical protein
MNRIEQMRDALGTVATKPHIVEYLERMDPDVLREVRAALHASMMELMERVHGKTN